jgi:carbonic anhydrase
MEMHSVHLPTAAKNGIKYAALGIFFSVDDFDDNIDASDRAIIDKFFESLSWDTETGTPKVAEVPYGDLMMMVNTNDRWVYKGSVTTPPCDTLVYWNVLRTVYPITAKHLSWFKDKQMTRSSMTSNYRVIQELGDRTITIIEGPGRSMVAVIVLIIILILVVIGGVTIWYKNKSSKEETKTDKPKEN